ncbi:hypothetical protein CMI37_33125 [Candidatus Pacearchaeota archaeon]|nr:hypothetical protein [Candidatus Pacearchaeota archaeon]|tara:strand:- start:2049 stop:2360 length:312 start_codon:yes stop_codon:yes gene_type:complete
MVDKKMKNKKQKKEVRAKSGRFFINSPKKRQVKVYFCPKCKNMDVGFIFGVRNLMGILPKIKCKGCGFEAGMFPLAVIEKGKLEKMNEEVRGKLNGEELGVGK